MSSVRAPAVAGSFYPANAGELQAMVAGFLAGVAGGSLVAVPKAIIAPHAGYVYSGPTAATVYARLAPARGRIGRVVLIGPSHRVAFRGLALCGATAYASPLGTVTIDRPMLEHLARLPSVGLLDAAHAQEHSLEVHLPFLQMVLGESFQLVPVVAGDATPDEVAGLLDAAWGGPETLIVVSTDLSHYLDYDTCRRVDAVTVRAVETLDPQAIGDDAACGRVPVRGLLVTAKRRGMAVQTVDVRNSGDTAGSRDRVVGYGAWAFLETSACVAGACVAGDARAAEEAGTTAGDEGDDGAALLGRHGGTLLRLSALSIRHGLATGQPVTVTPQGVPPDLAAHGAAFVTLTRNGQLRGCIGSPQAWRPLVDDVVDNAFKAAFKDPRFRPLLREEVPGLELSVSVLTAPRPMAFTDQEDLLSRMRPGVDGLIFEDRGHRGLFLPQVWESLPDPVEFLSHLKRKAGLAPDHWSPTVTVRRFTANAIKSRDLPDASKLWTDDMANA
ncbi:MAG: AmmeMemoRadiSam system protein B [Alphaproteobacteria bacterium]